MNKDKLKKIGISYSKMKEFLGCKRKFWYILHNWYSPTSNRNKNTYFGNLCHYISEFPYTKSPGIQKLFSICQVYDKNNPKSVIGVDDKDLSNDKALATIVMHEYFTTEILNQHRKIFKILKRELNLKRISVGSHKCNAKIDKILLNKNTKKIWLSDLKCKSKYDIMRIGLKLSIDKQLLLYSEIFKSVYKKPIEGILQEIIRKPQLRMTEKDGTLQNFLNRVSLDIRKRPEFYFQIISIKLTKERIDDFTSEFNQIMFEIYQCLEIGEKAFYKNDSLCESPYNCEFLQACCSGNMNQYLKSF